MEEEEHTDRNQQLAKLYQKINIIKQKYLNEDDTDNINQVISSNSPESCHSYLMELEKKRDPHLDYYSLNRLIDFYTKVFSNMPLGKHCQNEHYARMLVRFAELKAIQDVNEAEANFKVARSLCPKFAFVHIAHAQFEHSQGNTKRGIHILQSAIEEGTKPKEHLEAALQSMQAGRQQFCSEDKENVPVNSFVQDTVKKASEFQKPARTSDGTGDLQLSSIFSTGMEALPEYSHEDWRTGSQSKRAFGLPRRVPVLPFSIPENDDNNENISGKVSKRTDVTIPKSLNRQTSGSHSSSSLRINAENRDFVNQPPTFSPDEHGEDQVDSTTTLLQTRGSKGCRLEDVTFVFDQIISSSSPESCWAYLMKLEKRGNPHTDAGLLNKLKDCYSKVFTRLPIRQYRKNVSYARMLVRYAEVKGIEDPDEARDHFILARSNCNGFAFVHIAHAQFELSEDNAVKAASILHKALTQNAKPVELLDTAIRNLKAGEMLLVEEEDLYEESLMGDPCAAESVAERVPSCGGNQEVHLPSRVPVTHSGEQVKPPQKELVSERKVPGFITRHVFPEAEKTTPPAPKPVPYMVTPSVQLPSRLNPPTVYQTPNGQTNPSANSFITPVVNRGLEVPSSVIAAHRTGPVQQTCTPLTQATGFQTSQRGAEVRDDGPVIGRSPVQAPVPTTSKNASFRVLSNELITINGKQFFILKMIGRGGSSKVYQVFDQKKQQFAVKYVDLEEADAQTIESYKNEIEHLNHLQQYSDQIIKLYDYEITNGYIYMLMECGNLDLNTWLRKRKAVNPLERKYYWKNMLDAVHTIHRHGIIHSDLKPANFVFVDASLKLIDFGIANRIQPDVTSIMKDSQVGTLNYMPPEAIKDTSSQPGKARSKISPKGDVWSLGCILYCMTYGKTPFQSITNQIAKLHAIINPSHNIDFPDIPEKDLLDVLKRCLVRNPRERISIAELLEHSYLKLKPQPSPEPPPPSNSDLKRILTDLAALQSPNSIVRAANNLAKMCSSGRRLDVAECAKSSP